MITCLLCRVGRENPAQVKDGLRFRVVPIDRFHRLGHLRAERLPPSTASHSRGSLHYGNASSLIGGNLSLKEAWGLSFMVGTGDPPQKPHWVHALADAAWEGEGGQDSFCAWLRQWLDVADRDCRILRLSQGALGRLSLDLDSAAWLSSESPMIARLLAYDQSNDPTLGSSRRRWLKRLGASALVPELLAFWRRNAQRMVPDPAASGGSDYQSCADWAQALRELNPTSCKELLGQWSVAHHRRRNLWRALQRKGLSMSAGNGE